jgi:hypothetical protein
VTVELPLDGLIAEDAMGNAAALGGRKVVLSKTGRPVFLYDARGTAVVIGEQTGPTSARNLDPPGS